MEFQYVTIAVSNLDDSRTFYEGLLGFTPSVSYGRWQGYTLGSGSGFGINEEPGLQREKCTDTINFAVADVDGLWKRVRELTRVETALELMPWGTRKFVILDPDGMRLGFVEKQP